MGSLRRPFALLAGVVVLAFPTAAPAQPTNAPPGNSGIDEYRETVPGADGDKIPRAPAGGQPASPLSPRQRERLERLGRDGKSLADIIDATGPQPARTERAAKDADGRSPLRAIAGAAGGSDGGDGLGLVLPAILLITLLGALSVVLARRRGASS